MTSPARVALGLVPVVLVAGLAAGLEGRSPANEVAGACAEEIALSGGGQPGPIAFDETGRAWVGVTSQDRLVELDVASGRSTEHELPEESQPHGLAVSPDGAVWFAGLNDRIGRFEPATGETTIFQDGISRGAQPHQVLVDGEGIVYFSEQGLGRLGRLDPQSGSIEELAEGLPRRNRIHGLAMDGDGGIWTALQGADAVARFDPGTDTFVQTIRFSAGSGPHAVVVGSDGLLYVTLQRSSGLGVADPETGSVVEYATGIPAPTVSDLEPAPRVEDIVEGPEGTFWVTTTLADRLLSFDGQTARIELVACGLTSPAGPYEIAVGPNRSLWFTEQVGGRLATVKETD